MMIGYSLKYKRQIPMIYDSSDFVISPKIYGFIANTDDLRFVILRKPFRKYADS